MPAGHARSATTVIHASGRSSGALARARHDLPRELLPLGVALLETLGEGLRLLGILGEQQPQRVLRVVDPAGRIEARPST